ncbi:PEP/pyruvate-binding domain-containing protein [Desulfolutivibrio sp.]|uniref:PEP/pyruvate-binding domain-containing protein n=1 Tax=Desulfolutivibrio sp. TaxID=2773296 RepID=UPI002F96D65B
MSLTQLFRHWSYQIFAPGILLREKYNAFKELLRYDDLCLDIIAEIEDIHYGNEHADWARIVWLCKRLSSAVEHLTAQLTLLSPAKYVDLPEYARKIDFYVRMALDVPVPDMSPPYLLTLDEAAAHPELVGGKAAALGRLHANGGIPCPPGVVVTAGAFRYILEASELRPKLDAKLRKVILSKPDEMAGLAAELRQMVLSIHIPEDIAGPLRQAAEDMARVGNGLLAVRSSALAEDGQASFAGQYESVLSVKPEEVIPAYKAVLASKYGPRALTYRVLSGLSDEETSMAVLIMPMIEAKSAGVLYTLDPGGPMQGREVMGVYAAKGLGTAVVDGCIIPESVVLTRGKHPRVLVRDPDPEAMDAPETALPDEAAERLAEIGLRLESLFGRPQDVEWAMDKAADLFILQSRDVNADPQHADPEAADAEDGFGAYVDDGQPGKDVSGDLPTPLLTGGGRVSNGVVAGRAVHAQTVIEVSAIPAGAILLTPTLSPALARLAGRVAGVVAAAGSRAGHFASVAREFGLPVAVFGPEIFTHIPDGQEITLDADAGKVFPGRVESLIGAAADTGPKKITPLGTRLEKIIPLVARLTLTDPESPDFAPANMRSIHDVVRFAHEKSVAEMFSLVGRGGRGLASAKRLKTPLPFTMYILDLGGGLFEGMAGSPTVTPGEIKSAPMWAVWSGLTSPQASWDDDAQFVDWEELDRISGGIFSGKSRLLASYAVISANYAHLMIRFGYHFSVLDTVCGPEDKNNYINFRFKGGGGALDQRLSRIEFISRVLTHFSFTVTIKGDMLDARMARENEVIIQKRLAMLGYLLARTKLMDITLSADTDMRALVGDFLDKTDR